MVPALKPDKQVERAAGNGKRLGTSGFDLGHSLGWWFTSSSWKMAAESETSAQIDKYRSRSPTCICIIGHPAGGILTCWRVKPFNDGRNGAFWIHDDVDFGR